MNLLRTRLIDYPAETHPDATAFASFEGREQVKITYRELRNIVYNLGEKLLSQNLCGNIAVWGQDCMNWVIAHLTVLCGVGTAVALDKSFTDDQLIDHLIRIDAQALLYTRSHEKAAIRISERPECCIQVLCIDDLIEGIDHFALENHKYCVQSISDDTIAAIFFTSGTTGQDKGVMLTQKNIISDIIWAETAFPLTIDDTSLSVLPLHHSYALITGVYEQMAVPSTVFFAKDIRRIPKYIAMAQPTYMCVVPQVLEALLKMLLFTKADPSVFWGSIKRIICGGAACPPELVYKYSEFGISVLQGYGITECAPVVAVNKVASNCAETVGPPLAVNEVRIIDCEVCVRGDNVFVGYWEDEAATRDALVDGWFRTGDLGEIDSTGRIKLIGRKKNLIILDNGENVSPEELENQIYTATHVQECVVRESAGVIEAEIFIGDAIDHENCQKAHEQIAQSIEMLNRQWPMYKRIGKITYRDKPFPKTSTQKIIRKQEDK